MKSFAFPTSPPPRSVSSRFTYPPPLGRYTAPRVEERESDVGKKFGELDYSSVLTCASFTPRERSLSGSGWKIYIYIYIRGYATIRGGRKYFIRGVERKKDLGFEEFRPNFLRFSLPGENYSSPCTLISNELITSLILLIFSKLGVA